MSKMLRVGLVGLGRIFDLNCLGYRDNPQVEVVALCDTRDDLLQRRSALFPTAHLSTDYADFLSRDLDLVDVLTPHPLHAEMTIAALRAGAHVSVQKPIAMTLRKADAMIAAAGGTDKRLRVFESFLIYEPLVRAKELLDAGAIGRPLHFRMKVVLGNRAFAWSVPAEASAWRDALGRGVWAGRSCSTMGITCWRSRSGSSATSGTSSRGSPRDGYPRDTRWMLPRPSCGGTSIRRSTSSGTSQVAPRLRIRTDYYAAHKLDGPNFAHQILTTARPVAALPRA